MSMSDAPRCPYCGTFYGTAVHYCGNLYSNPALPVAPLTEADVRRIVREEIQAALRGVAQEVRAAVTTSEGSP